MPTTTRCSRGPLTLPARWWLELADRFTQVFLLEIDEPTMLARLDARLGYHDWGRIGDTGEYLRRKLPELQDRLRAFGAIPIDARQPLDQVVDAILSHTLASSAASQCPSRSGRAGTELADLGQLRADPDGAARRRC